MCGEPLALQRAGELLEFIPKGRAVEIFDQLEGYDGELPILARRHVCRFGHAPKSSDAPITGPRKQPASK
jgi:hypothetical protein